MIVAYLLPPMSVENIQLNLKQQMNTKGTCITGSSLLPNGRMVMSCNSTNTVSFINTEEVELFQKSSDNSVSDIINSNVP
jgi:hypothetical protein